MTRTEISIETEDGRTRAGLFGAGNGANERPGVILYMDAFGPRPALDGMAERLAGEGYVVLVPDLFYRFGDYGPFDAGTAFSDPAVKERIMGMVKGTSLDDTDRDTRAFVRAIGEAGATGPLGAVGYCMGGAKALMAAVSHPSRVKAAASFHGGNLAADTPESFHHRVRTIEGRLYVGTAGVDRSFPPEQSARLAEALRTVEIDHTIENYTGMAHGWAVPDHGVYDESGAERHWKRLLTLFAETLH